MRLADLGYTMDFDSTPGYRKPGIQNRLNARALLGTLYDYNVFNKKYYSVPMDFVNTTDKSIIDGWFVNRNTITFYPDYANNPATYYLVKIMNKSNPLDSFAGPNWETFFRGTLEIEEI
jgi:hypothetical protein